MSTAPTLSGFLSFIRNQMAISTVVLPDGSDVISQAFELSLATVNSALTISPLLYNTAVYNLGGDILINFAPDQSGQTYFETLRSNYKIYDFAPGVVTSSSDGGTSTSLTNLEAMKNFTLMDLQRLKTPYGRVYIGIAQAYGPNVWGLS
jgi:hypothetical protein